ncbi:MAG: hypothetical protein QOG10_22 [Kribbellaceae bacterium]|nr:hypothetical protein [Kribbellaceae bacterium]
MRPVPKGDGSDVGLVFSSVFKSDKVSTVVYTRGKKAWYAKVYRLGGIPGWVESSVEMKGEQDAKGNVGPEDPKNPQVAVFVYDQHGTLLAQFPDHVRSPL